VRSSISLFNALNWKKKKRGNGLCSDKVWPFHLYFEGILHDPVFRSTSGATAQFNYIDLSSKPISI